MALETATSIPPHRSPADLHAALEQVRRMKEFAPPEPGPLERLMDLPWLKMMTEKWQAGFQEILNGLRDFLSQMSPSGSDFPPYLLDVASTAAGLLLVLLGVFGFYLLLGALRRMLPRAAASTEDMRIFEGTLLRTAAHHREQAARLAGEGRLDAAMRELYLALLCLLEERGIVSYEPTRSNAEYRYLLGSARPALLGGFAKIAGAFESSRYGAHPLDAGRYQACEQDYQHALESTEGLFHD